MVVILVTVVLVGSVPVGGLLSPKWFLGYGMLKSQIVFILLLNLFALCVFMAFSF